MPAFTRTRIPPTNKQIPILRNTGLTVIAPIVVRVIPATIAPMTANMASATKTVLLVVPFRAGRLFSLIGFANCGLILKLFFEEMGTIVPKIKFLLIKYHEVSGDRQCDEPHPIQAEP